MFYYLFLRKNEDFKLQFINDRNIIFISMAIRPSLANRVSVCTARLRPAHFLPASYEEITCITTRLASNLIIYETKLHVRIFDTSSAVTSSATVVSVIISIFILKQMTAKRLFIVNDLLPHFNLLNNYISLLYSLDIRLHTVHALIITHYQSEYFLCSQNQIGIHIS